MSPAATSGTAAQRLAHQLDAAGVGAHLLPKLRQLPPSVPNAVLVTIDGDTAEALDIGEAIRALRARADAKDEAFFARRGFDGSRGFYDRFLRLGVMFITCERAAGHAAAVMWPNPSARIALPERAARACLLSLRAGAIPGARSETTLVG